MIGKSKLQENLIVHLIQVFILLFLERSQKMIWFPLALIVSLDFMIPLDGTEIRHEINSVYNILAIFNIPMVADKVMISDRAYS